ncbi:MAG TPA: DUF4388 domain-containing protein [Acidimicrobiales bacterium]|nr:DUF4388 domain-containing protein [Acidimicrobiales bacterium]
MSGPAEAGVVAATLSGSLESFSFFEVLELLGRKARAGHLRVTGPEADRALWVDGGDLLDVEGTGERAVLLELACLEQGEFTFTTAAVPEGCPRRPIATVLADLEPHVEEWRSLTARLPSDATVRMAPFPPAASVEVRADQWSLLALAATGRTVREVVEASPAPALETLRTLRELADAQLVTVARPVTSAPSPSPSSHEVPPPLAGPPSPSSHEVPPPLAGPPSPPSPPAGWTPVVAPQQAPMAEQAAAPSQRRPAHLASFASVPSGLLTEVPPSSEDGEGVPGADQDPGASAAQPVVPLSPVSGLDDDDPGELPSMVTTAPVPVMPPPISGDPWSSSIGKRRSRRFAG